MTDPKNEAPLTERTFWRFFQPIDPDNPPVVINDDTGERI